MNSKTTFPALLAAALLLAGCATPAPTPAARVTAVPIEREAALAAVNAFRGEHGLKALAINETLMRAATAQSAAMAARDTMDHEVAGVLTTRVETAGYRWGTVAENIAKSYPDYDGAMKAWIHSPGHRRNLLDPRVTEIGFAGERASAGGKPYWTQIFASPSRRVSAPAASEKPLRWGPELRFP
ncbi:CAP domain-containing protein [Aureimonas pseudogalii]|uniref:Uncharacterized protein YkwD n=1 Tax=Aureimonas pseudogalii TaxID=1744844 RepID=A0A7W6E9V9_9HYPH|nr:CAP domain-containing protein [Aureimonas pseudogalii]MBB3996954.1 uncharacterized protein YkwD [Aureimonas pseudogalii]